ncbi:MAG TPA: glycosyltransferase family 1 protein, partial [Mycobacterium sp.]|nr:glycosyltransferase family 1 protein [Mycobacterium sp.]
MASTNSVRSLLVWHVHGSWTESLVAGRHRYVIPVNEAADSRARGLSGRQWPRAQEVPVDQLRETDVDLVILQRPEELELAEQWLGRRPGVDVPAVYVEHNAPRPSPVDSVHPLA